MSLSSAPRTAILAALPREIMPLVRSWPIQNRSLEEGIFRAECEKAIAVCAGMGPDRVTRAFEIAQNSGLLSSVVSVGYAGGLRPEISAGSVHWPAIIINGITGERYVCKQGNGTLVSTNHVVHREEKIEIAARWSADMIDMEAATVANLALRHGFPFRTLRVVSDTAEDVLPDLDRFTDRHGGFREAAFAKYILLRPWLVPVAMRLGRHAAEGSAKIAAELRNLLK